MSANSKIKLELLAPAKDKICAREAILAGADAIYIGANAFGARSKAGNSLEDLKEIIDFAHIFNVKVYVTVNTIIYDNELKSVEKLIWDLYNIKTDAIIFQDFAVFKMNLPPIELHASTQCHNISAEKIEFLQKCNVKRVVLPREFSIEQIKNIKKHTNVELEAFCHGALCVSYSGQCYLSDYIGKRSANRGECAQPCRKQYSLIDAKGNVYAKNQHLLCLKDFNLSDKMSDLIYAGATSFKIEGRLKDEVYVKNTVLKYSQILDEFISQNPNYERASIQSNQVFDFELNLEKTFNRGFCEYFINGKPNKITSFDTPKFKGEFIGVVKNISKNEIILDTKKSLNIQDGITFFDNNELTGTKIIAKNGQKYKVLSANGLKVGIKIYRNHDEEYIKQLVGLKLARKCPVSFKINIGKTLEIIAVSSGVSVSKIVDNNFELANNQQIALENLAKQFSKLGNTNFVMQDFSINGEVIPYLKLSEINSFRNEIIAQLENKILEKYQPRYRNLDFEQDNFYTEMLDYSYNISNHLAKEFVESANAKVKEYAPEIANNHRKLMTTKHCLKREFRMCQKDVGQLFLVDEYGNKYPLHFDCKNCQMEIYKTDI